MESDARQEDDVAVLTEAFHARRRGDYQGAIERFRKVFERDPSNPWPLIESAKVEFMRTDFLAMRDYLRQAEVLAGEDAEVWLAMASAWMDCLDPEESLRTAELGARAEVADPRFLTARLLALERLNRIREAAAVVDAAGELPPGNRVAAARVLRRADRAEEARLLVAGDHSAAALMERARVLDHMGKHRLAVESLAEAKRKLAAHPESEYERKLAPLHRPQQQRELGFATAEQIVRWREERTDAPLRLAFLLGHPRSGTTLLESLIERRGGAAIASEFPVLEGRLRLWVADLATRDTSISPLLKSENLPRLRAAYWNQIHHLAGAQEGQLVIDKNPGLTDGVQWVAKIFPEAKILTALRDPRDVIVSCVFQDFGFTRLGVACLSWEGAAKSWAATMNHWADIRERLPAGQWLEVRYEELVMNPDGVMQDVLGFLGLAALSEETKTDRLIRTPSYPEAANAVHSRAVARWKDYERWLKPLRPIIEPVMRRLGYEW
ncbi:sulfotransferase [Luteolibacter ambystomatis]|uniref:Sulfotransferase n=1 Tax=Luteolibacter ambystomatis TaxID=2824561 RepID=A0A975G858_9BACT|nr:sulfotransferase [Luteolibacter ambystomatis]QUE50733.1 sulfotransferase [Luteolibacter ambystomatis]